MKRLCLSLVASFLCFTFASAAAQPSVVAGLSSEFTLTEIGDGFVASSTQMAFAPDGGLYISTFQDGVLRFDYDPTGNLPAPVQAVDQRSLGIAFHDSQVHGLCMYLTPHGGPSAGSILRLTDDDGDGAWGEAGETRVAIVEGVPVGLHSLDQIQIRGNTLWVGIGSRTDQGDDESAFNGTVAWIQDLDQVPSAVNAAGYPGVDLFLDPAPFLTSTADRLVIHSSGSRNPFGLALDGDGDLWMTNNQLDADPTPADEIFHCSYQADYGFPAANASVDWRTHPAVLGAGFFDPARLTPSLTVAGEIPNYEPDVPTPGPPPGSLGPHSSADGFDFYDGNEFPLRFHKDAFVTRASSSSPDFTGLSEPYEDLVAVDRNTGEVVQIADDFNRPLDALEDGSGQLLIAEFHRFGNGQGKIYRLAASAPVSGAHAFEWGSDANGQWFDRLRWNVSLPEDDRLVPHQWGAARYSVTVDRPGAAPTVELDRHADVESLFLGDGLALGSEGSLWIDGDLSVQAGASITMALDGLNTKAGTVSTDPRIRSGGTAQLAGSLTLSWSGPVAPGSRFLLIEAELLQGGFAPVSAPGQVLIEQQGNQLWATLLSGTDAPKVSVPIRSRILGNQPNPFNPSTRIDFRVEIAGPVKLTVYDAAGRRIVMLLDETIPPGAYSSSWDGTDTVGATVASGVYFVRLGALDGDSVHRMTLLK